MQALTSDDKKELCKDAFQDISAILAGLRDQGLSDLEIFEFGKSLIDHFDRKSCFYLFITTKSLFYLSEGTS